MGLKESYRNLRINSEDNEYFFLVLGTGRRNWYWARSVVGGGMEVVKWEQWKIWKGK